MDQASRSLADAEIRRRCLIGGRGQMVGFRMYATLHAHRLGIRGWVRNLPSGEVEVLAEGPPSGLMEFLSLLEQGPAAAQVTSFVVAEELPGSPLPQFGLEP